MTKAKYIVPASRAEVLGLPKVPAYAPGIVHPPHVALPPSGCDLFVDFTDGVPQIPDDYPGAFAVCLGYEPGRQLWWHLVMRVEARDKMTLAGVFRSRDEALAALVTQVQALQAEVQALQAFVPPDGVSH